MQRLGAKANYRLGLAMILAGMATATHAEGLAAPASPPDKASQCFACHGAEGHPSLADVPIIAGQQPVYLQNTLNAYRSGLRGGGRAIVMREITKRLSDDDIAALAAWFGDQK
ncbi:MULTISPECIES: c-type cytochrome [Neorhizobium]|jgi:cytochrome c553|uniref:c-type cytochrome n=1 Tax=Neorhizobium TaxID=1525371 RepID=UPI000CF87A3C|nr:MULTISPECIES: c-type cytochrome [Neorhizobium]